MLAGGLHVRDLCFQVAATAEPAETVVLKGRPGVDRDEHEHRDHEYGEQQRHRAER